MSLPAHHPPLPAAGPLRRRHCLARLGALGGSVLAGAALSGCAFGPLRPATADDRACLDNSAGERHRRLCLAGPVPPATVEAEARRLQPDAQRLTVVVIRQRWADAVNRVPLSVDGGAALDTLPQSFVRLRLAPGRHVLRAQWGGGGGGEPAAGTELAVQGRAGELLCVELIGSVWLWRSQYRLEPTTPAQAAERVRALRLVADLG